MRNLIVIFIGILLLISCSEQFYVTSDSDKSADLSQYRTFDWAEETEDIRTSNPLFDNEINRRRIKEAIEQELKTLAILKVDSIPDLLIDFHLLVDEKVNYIAHDYYPFAFRYWPNYDISSYTVNKSTIVIHLVDFKKEQLVWLGTGSWTLGDPPTSEKQIQLAIKEILNQFQKERRIR